MISVCYPDAPGPVGDPLQTEHIYDNHYKREFTRPVADYSGTKPGAPHLVASSAKSTVMLLPFRPMTENSSHPFYGW